MVSVTLDTSVYVGAFNSRGSGSRLLGMARAGQLRIDISDAILSERMRVLREKFAFRLSKITNRVAPTRPLAVISPDPPDNRILESYAGIRIMRVTDVLELEIFRVVRMPGT